MSFRYIQGKPRAIHSIIFNSKLSKKYWEVLYDAIEFTSIWGGVMSFGGSSTGAWPGQEQLLESVTCIWKSQLAKISNELLLNQHMKNVFFIDCTFAGNFNSYLIEYLIQGSLFSKVTFYQKYKYVKYIYGKFWRKKKLDSLFGYATINFSILLLIALSESMFFEDKFRQLLKSFDFN